MKRLLTNYQVLQTFSGYHTTVVKLGTGTIGLSRRWITTFGVCPNDACLGCILEVLAIVDENSVMMFHQLVAYGQRSRIGGSDKIYSRRIFTTRARADAYKEKFREIVTTPKNKFDLNVLVNDSLLQIGIVELEAEE